MTLQEADGGFKKNATLGVVLAVLAAAIGFSVLTNSLAPGALLLGGAGVVAARALVLKGVEPLRRKTRRSLPAPIGDERALLRAIRDNGGGITPVGAAMEVPVSVEEADRRLSELAGAGYLFVEHRGGALIYCLPEGDPARG